MIGTLMVGKCRHGIYDCYDCEYEEWLDKQKVKNWKKDPEELYLYKRVRLLDDEDKSEPE